ncbi:GlcG/HbpS family heme-binding protein [Pseudorhodobacter ferrugineus]|uniref:GlcG/HbpS family heme-binding protein n=1 Tax=Pseudorhodobacter ferrugineus TaxID=77008 RepID=UPI0004195F4C|nr:heme-binding protein [Pseudorhodobacter ferrugineus]
MALTLRKARAIIKGIFAKSSDAGFKPLSIVVLDAGGHVLAFERADGASVGRFEIARGKAYGCIMLGMGGSAIQARGEAQAVFVDAMNGVFDGRFVPVKGGVLVRDAKGAVLGAVGVTGDASDNDLIAAVAGIEAAGLVAEG